MKRHGSNYRGTRKGIGVLIPILVVLCVVAAVALYVIDNNTTYSKEGTSVLPEREEKQEEVTEPTIIVENEDGSSEIVETSEETSPTIEVQEVKALFIPIASVKSKEAFANELASAKSLDVNTLVLEVKAEDGGLAFATKSALGAKNELMGDSTMLSEAVAKAKGEGYSVAFYVSCFRDNESARKNVSSAVCTGNKVLWIDGEVGQYSEMRWLSPYSESATAYLTDVIAELSAFTPDEIILSNVSFPAIGKTEIITYEDNGVQKAEKLSAFITSAKSAAGGIKLSAVYENYTGAALTESGQSAELFASMFDTVYINLLAEKKTASFEDAKGHFKKAIPIANAPTGNEYIIKK